MRNGNNLIYLSMAFCIVLALICTYTVIHHIKENRTYTIENQRLEKINEAYNRAVVCFTSVTPTKRTPDYVKLCYVEAEKATGAKIERYGDAIQ